MSAQIVRKRKWFMPWQDEEEETWLREMSQEGLHLQSLGLLNSYRFMRGEPADYAYRLDFQLSSKVEMQDYLQLFEDAGWEHLGEKGSSHYFRRSVENGEKPEIFTDVDSKIEKYKRVLRGWAFILPPYMIIAMIQMLRQDAKDPYTLIALVLVTLLLAFYALVTAKVVSQIKKLEKLARSTN